MEDGHRQREAAQEGEPPEVEEREVLTTGLHSVVFARALFAVGVGIAFLVAGHTLLGVLFGVCGAVLTAAAVLRRRFFQLTLTTNRLTVDFGVLAREHADLRLTRLEALAASQGPVGRLVDFGTVIITETGGSRSSFSSVARPLAFRHAVLQQIESMQNRTTQVQARPSSSRLDDGDSGAGPG